MPFYLRFHLGPLGYSHRIGGRPQRRRAGAGPTLKQYLVTVALVGYLFAFGKNWLVGLFILMGVGLFAALFMLMTSASRPEAARGEHPEIESGEQPAGPPRYAVRASKAGAPPIERGDLTGPQAEKLQRELQKDGWRTDVSLVGPARPSQ